MIIKHFIFWVLIFVVSTTSVSAVAPSDYADRFVVDMNAKIPPIKELYEKYAPPPIYDRKFDYYWNIGDNFDKSFAGTIKTYGTREKRIKWDNEEILVKSIQNMPREMYPYIGPYLHSLPGIPEKILNMPGIKETKNTFPERVAKKMADIENLEFLSPALYIALMPEVWGENDNIEKAVPRVIQPVNRYDSTFMDKVLELVPPENFAPGTKVEAPLESRLRTISPDANSTLTTRDIGALIRSFGDIGEFSEDIYNKALVLEAGGLLDSWEDDMGNGAVLPMIKDLVHPCQRLVQKLKMQGLEKDFALLVAKEGFSVEEWAYTCDKSIKAYRVLRMTTPELLTLMLYKKNIYENQLAAYQDEIGPSIAITMQSMVEMYKAPIGDVLEVKKNQNELKAAFEKLKYRIAGQPIDVK